MAGPFEKYYYHESLQRYLMLFSVIVSDLKVDTERGLVQVPNSTSLGRRNNINRQQSSNSLPYATIVLGSSFEVDKSATSSKQNQLITENARAKNRLPVIIPLEYNVRTKKYGEAMQIVEQFYGNFYPSMDCAIEDNNTLKQRQNIKIKLLSHDIQDNWEGDGTEPLHYDLSMNFELYGYLYGYDYWVKGRDGDGEDPNKIMTVIIDRGLTMDIHWSDLPEWFRVDKDGTHYPTGDTNE